MECMLHCLEGSCRTNSADPSTSVNNPHNNPAWRMCELCEMRALIARDREPVSLRDARDVQSCCSSDRSSRSMPGAARGMLEAGSGVDCCSRSTTQEGDPTVTEESFLGELCRYRYRYRVPIQSNPIQSIICQSWCLCVEERENPREEERRRGEHRTVVVELDGLERACSRETRRDGADETVARQTQRDHIAVRVARDAEPRLIAWQSASPVGLRPPLESSSLSEQAHQCLCCVCFGDPQPINRPANHPANRESEWMSE